MSTLFDISPDEPTKKRGARAKGRREVAPAQEPEKTPFYSRELPPRAVLPIGTIDHTYKCLDQKCQAEFSDILLEESREWLLQCAFCGTMQWVPVIRGHLKPKEREFTFNDGRFAGLTVAEAFRSPRGEEYVAWASREHKRPAVRAACKTFLDSRPASE